MWCGLYEHDRAWSGEHGSVESNKINEEQHQPVTIIMNRWHIIEEKNEDPELKTG